MARRVGAWVAWWMLLMAFWVWVDDSVDLAELLAGAGAAAIATSLTELVQHQSRTHLGLRANWLAAAAMLPGQVVRDTGVLLGVLWRAVARGEQPPSRFALVPVDPGDDSAEGALKRALLSAGLSVAPNTFVLDVDRQRRAMVVHQLVPRPVTSHPRHGGGARP